MFNVITLKPTSYFSKIQYNNVHVANFNFQSSDTMFIFHLYLNQCGDLIDKIQKL